MRNWLLLGIVLIPLWLVVVYLSDPFLLTIYGLAAALWVALPVLIIAILASFLARRSGRSPKTARGFIFAVLVLACFIGLAIPFNYLAQQHAVRQAKAYPDLLAPLLENYRQDHGKYPATLDELSSKPRIPRLLRRPFGYQSDGKRYWFTFPQPGGLIDVWNYDSETKTWHLST